MGKTVTLNGVNYEIPTTGDSEWGSKLTTFNESVATAINTFKVSVPATKTSTGTIGQWAAETGFLYICIATNTWQRCVIADW
jgi:hypothetical protein